MKKTDAKLDILGEIREEMENIVRLLERIEINTSRNSRDDIHYIDIPELY